MSDLEHRTARELAREAREILCGILAAAQPAGLPNGMIVSSIIMRFALTDRLERLCAALAPEPQPNGGHKQCPMCP